MRNKDPAETVAYVEFQLNLLIIETEILTVSGPAWGIGQIYLRKTRRLSLGFRIVSIVPPSASYYVVVNMPYIMEMYVDGACRGNGKPGAIGAAACVVMSRAGRYSTYTCRLPYSDPRPTNQRAELQAIILALEQAWYKYGEMRNYPDMQVTIFTDSKYAVGCMTRWKQKWLSNDFFNSAGYDVVNRDLIEEAYELHQNLDDVGSVEYEWIPRADNQLADDAVNEELDEM